jgi:hypothetical protein
VEAVQFNVIRVPEASAVPVTPVGVVGGDVSIEATTEMGGDVFAELFAAASNACTS